MSDRPEILVRDAVCDDWQSIVEFNRRLAVETEHKLLDLEILEAGVRRGLSDPERLRYWVAEVQQDGGRRVIGQTAITREWSDWRNGWVWIPSNGNTTWNVRC